MKGFVKKHNFNEKIVGNRICKMGHIHIYHEFLEKKNNLGKLLLKLHNVRQSLNILINLSIKV